MSQSRLLLVKGESSLRADLQQRLIDLGYTIAEVSTSESGAREQIQDFQPDAILFDIDLSGEADVATAAEVLHEQHNVPVILVVAAGNKTEWTKTETSHATDYVLKPFDNRELRAVIDTVVSKHKLNQKREAQFRTIFESTAIGIGEIDAPTGRWLQVNDRLCSLTGFSRSELLKMDIREIPLSGTANLSWETLTQRLAGNTREYSVEMPFVRKDGRTLHLKMHLSASRQVHGEPIQLFATLEDITSLKKLEDQNCHLHRLEAVDQLIGSTTHDFNNILATIMMHLGLLRMNGRLSVETRRTLEELESEARRAATLIRQLHALGRRSPSVLKPLALNELVVGVLKTLERLAGDQINLHFEGATDLPLVELDTGMVEELLVLLAVQARGTLPRGGQLLIRTTLVLFVGESRADQPQRPSGRFVCLSAAYRSIPASSPPGVQISASSAAQRGEEIPDVALASMRGIVARLNGWIERDLKRGTTFRAYLPALNRPIDPEPSR